MNILEKKVVKSWITKVDYPAVILLLRDKQEVIMKELMKDLKEWHCGYVAIPNNHPLTGRREGEHCECLEECLESVKNKTTIGNRGVIPSLFWDEKTTSMEVVFDVHGSITFSETSTTYPMPTPNPTHWIGFDCRHFNDNLIICNEDYCINECENLAHQLKKIELITLKGTKL